VQPEGYVIRDRTRRCASPKEGMRQKWGEVQVVLGRRVVARFDLREQAVAWIARNPIPTPEQGAPDA